MADLDFQQVLIVGGVATVGLTLLFYWYSAVMVERNWSYQVRAKAGGKGGPKQVNEAPSELHGQGGRPAAPAEGAPAATPKADRARSARR